MKVHSFKWCIEEKGFGFHHKSAFVGRTRKIKDKCILEEERERVTEYGHIVIAYLRTIKALHFCHI